MALAWETKAYLDRKPVTMASSKDFEDIVAWQQAVELAGRIHDRFKDHKDFSYRDHIRRAATSASSNMAEGSSRGANRDFRRFLWIAKGYCDEVRSLPWIGKRYGYIADGELDELRNKARRVSGIKQDLIGSLRLDMIRSWVGRLWPVGSAWPGLA